MTRKKPVYTREFKMAILAQVNSGIPVPQVARGNGLHPSLVFRWRHLYLEDPVNAFAGPGNPYKEHTRIAELEHTVGRLYSENKFPQNFGDLEGAYRRGETKIRASERFQMIGENQCTPAPIPVKRDAELVGVSKSGYYKWLAREGYDGKAERDRQIIKEFTV